MKTPHHLWWGVFIEPSFTRRVRIGDRCVHQELSQELAPRKFADGLSGRARQSGYYVVKYSIYDIIGFVPYRDSEGKRYMLFRKPRGLRFTASVMTYLLRFLLRTFALLRIFKVKVTNRKAVRRKGRMIVACNHISIADPIYLWGAMRRNAVAIAMAELWKVPVINVGMWLLGHIPVKRGDKRSGERVMRASEAVLNWGGALLIYPSAKCAKPGERLPLKSGVAVLAVRTNSPIIPAGIIGSNEVKPLGSLALNRSARVLLNFGEAIDPCDFAGPNQVNDIMAELERRIVALSV